MIDFSMTLHFILIALIFFNLYLWCKAEERYKKLKKENEELKKEIEELKG